MTDLQPHPRGHGRDWSVLGLSVQAGHERAGDKERLNGKSAE